MRGFLRTAGWITMLLLATAVALVSLRYFLVAPEKAAGPEQGASFARHLPQLLAHVAGGVLALFLGPWQFWGGLRRRRPALHRWLGRAYLLGAFGGGLAGLALAATALGGPVARTGFAALAVVWLSTSTLALLRIRQRRVREHREWMVRNYALTFAAVTLRLWLPALQAMGIDPLVAYTTVAWLSWVPNLAVAELYLRGAGGSGAEGRGAAPLRGEPPA